MCTLRLLLIWCCAVAVVAADPPVLVVPAGHDAAVVELQRGGNRLFASVTFAGQGSASQDGGYVLIDTGGERSIIDAALAERLHLVELGQAAVTSGGTGRPATMRRVEGLRLGDIALGGFPAVAVDLSGLRKAWDIPCIGILGADIWMSVPFRLEMARRRLTIFVADRCQPPAEGTPITVELSRGRLWTPVSLDGRPAGLACIDSGHSPALSMGPALMLDDPTLAKRILGLTPTAGITGSTLSALIDVGTVDVLGLRFPHVRMMVQGGRPVKSPDGVRGVLGAGLLRQVVLTVDAARGKAWCSRVSDRPAVAMAQRLVPDLIGFDDLMQAADAGDVADCRALLAAGADPRRCDRKGRSALLYAVNHAEVDVARLLVAQGAPVDVRDALGQTALGLAMDSRMPAMERCLRELGATDEGTHRPAATAPATAAARR